MELAKKDLLKAQRAVSLQSDTCFYIASLGEDGKTDTGLVLEAASVDKYAPRTTGVYNIGLKTKAKGNKA
jgi:hypothetical protein